MFVPLWILIAVGVLLLLSVSWLSLILRGRNPLPFPDPGSRIFTAASPEAKAAVVAVLGEHGLAERFRADSSGILRSIMWDGTIINNAPADIIERLGGVQSCIGLVSDNPDASAARAVESLRRRGFTADIVENIEPELPIAFLVTNALPGTAINFRKHVMHLPRPQSV